MTVVSSKEFVTNQDRYFAMAIDEEVCIKRGEKMFHLMPRFIDGTNVKERVYYDPDEDFYNSITMDELLIGVKEDLQEMFMNKRV